MRRAAAVIPIPMRGSPAGPLLLIALLGCAASCARAGFTTAPDDVAGDGVVDHTAERSTDAPPADGGDSGQDQAAPDGPPAPGTHRWARRIGRAGAVESLALASDASGNVIAAGTFRGQIDLGGGDLLGGAGREVFLASFSAEGDHRWSRAFGGSGDDQALDVAGGPGGRIVVSGRFAGVVDFGGAALTSAGGYDAFLASFDAAGAPGWSLRLGGEGDDQGRSVAVDPAGNIALTGAFAETVDLGGEVLTSAGGDDIFVASFTAGGARRWTAAAGDVEWDHGYGVAFNGDGELFVTGTFAGTVDLGGGPLTSAGARDILVASFDADGAHRWSAGFGGPSADGAADIAVDPGGDVAIAGHFGGAASFGSGELQSSGLSDIFVASFSGDGQPRWSKGYGAISFDHGRAVAVAPDGDVVLAGHFRRTVDFDGSVLTSLGSEDLVLARYNTSGTMRWIERFGGPGISDAHGVALDASGRVAVVGAFANSIDVGAQALNSAGMPDGFVAAFVP